MKVITQLIDYFHGKGRLTPEQLAYLARTGFCGEHDYFEPDESCEEKIVVKDGDLEVEQARLEGLPCRKKKIRRSAHQARRLQARAREANRKLIGSS